MMCSRITAQSAPPARPLLAAALALAALLGGTGCGSNSTEQQVKFESTPLGATVSIDGTPIGQTPTRAMLGKQRDTRVTFTRPGFEPATEIVRPRGDSLTPNPVKVTLRPENLPGTPGENPSDELAKRLRIVRQQAATGQITAEDQTYIETILIQFYTQQGATPPPPAPPAPTPPPGSAP